MTGGAIALSDRRTIRKSARVYQLFCTTKTLIITQQRKSSHERHPSYSQFHPVRSQISYVMENETTQIMRVPSAQLAIHVPHHPHS